MTLATTQIENERLRGPLLSALKDADIDGSADTEELLDLVEDVLVLRGSLAALRPAMAKTVAVPPGIARVAQATENAWRAIEQEFGLLRSSEVSRRLGSLSTSNRNLANEHRQAGRLIATKRLNAYRYPGFQLSATGIRPVIQPLVSLVTEAGWSSDDLILWLCAPSGAFGGDRPVDHLDDDDFIQRARDVLIVEW